MVGVLTPRHCDALEPQAQVAKRAVVHVAEDGNVVQKVKLLLTGESLRTSTRPRSEHDLPSG